MISLILNVRSDLLVDPYHASPYTHFRHANNRGLDTLQQIARISKRIRDSFLRVRNAVQDSSIFVYCDDDLASRKFYCVFTSPQVTARRKLQVSLAHLAHEYWSESSLARLALDSLSP